MSTAPALSDPAEGIEGNPAVFTYERVLTHRAMREEWEPLLRQIFTDPDDLESLDELLDRLDQKGRNFFHMMRDSARTPVAMELVQMHESIPEAGYEPWGGLIEKLRNKGLYPLMSKVSDERMKKYGMKYTLYDLEDPKRILPVYSDEDAGEVLKRVEGRINFWRREGCFVVDDVDAPYVRPESGDPKKNVQAYDLLAIRPHDLNDPMWKDEGIFRFDESGKIPIEMSRAAYRRFYLEMNHIQYGQGPLDEAKLRAEYPAVDVFLKSIDAVPAKQWFSLRTNEIRQSAHPKFNAVVELAPEQAILDRPVANDLGGPEVNPAALAALRDVSISPSGAAASFTALARPAPAPAEDNGEIPQWLKQRQEHWESLRATAPQGLTIGEPKLSDDRTHVKIPVSDTMNGTEGIINDFKDKMTATVQDATANAIATAMAYKILKSDTYKHGCDIEGPMEFAEAVDAAMRRIAAELNLEDRLEARPVTHVDPTSKVRTRRRQQAIEQQAARPAIAETAPQRRLTVT